MKVKSINNFRRFDSIPIPPNGCLRFCSNKVKYARQTKVSTIKVKVTIWKVYTLLLILENNHVIIVKLEETLDWNWLSLSTPALPATASHCTTNRHNLPENAHQHALLVHQPALSFPCKLNFCRNRAAILFYSKFFFICQRLGWHEPLYLCHWNWSDGCRHICWHWHKSISGNPWRQNNDLFIVKPLFNHVITNHAAAWNWWNSRILL